MRKSRVIEEQIASASAVSFLFFVSFGLTNCGGINRTP